MEEPTKSLKIPTFVLWKISLRNTRSTGMEASSFTELLSKGIRQTTGMTSNGLCTNIVGAQVGWWLASSNGSSRTPARHSWHMWVSAASCLLKQRWKFPILSANHLRSPFNPVMLAYHRSPFERVIPSSKRDIKSLVHSTKMLFSKSDSFLGITAMTYLVKKLCCFMLVAW